MLLNQLPEDHRVEVPKQLWDRVEGKIDLHKKGKRIRSLRIALSAAAIFVVVLGIGLIYFTQQQHNPNIFATNHQYSQIVFEDLKSPSQPLYDQQQLEKLNHIVLKSYPNFLDTH